jgi:hypothetical protein
MAATRDRTTTGRRRACSALRNGRV